MLSGARRGSVQSLWSLHETITQDICSEELMDAILGHLKSDLVPRLPGGERPTITQLDAARRGLASLSTIPPIVRACTKIRR